MRVIFRRDYDHRWPSRAITAFKAGYEGTIHREAGAAAVAKGAATEVPRPAKAAPDDIGENRSSDSLDSGDHRPVVPGSPGRAGRRLHGDRDVHGSASRGHQPVGDAE